MVIFYSLSIYSFIINEYEHFYSFYVFFLLAGIKYPGGNVIACWATNSLQHGDMACRIWNNAERKEHAY